MPSNLCQRSAIAVAITACFPVAVFAAGVARVDFASGNVAAISTDGRSRTLSKGSEIEVGETVSTQAGRAQLRFADGAYMSLQPQTEFKVEEFKFSGKQEASDGILMNLLKGGMRTITGLIGRTNRNAYRLKTDVATIGIRGTEYSVRYTNSIELFVADGLVSVENQSGSFTVPGGSGVMVSNNQTPPQQTDQKPVLPPESPVSEDAQQVTQQTTDPVNPLQEAFPPIPVPAGAAVLTGTLPLNMAFAFCGDGCGFGGFQQMETVGTLDGNGALVSFVNGAGTTTIGNASVAQAGNDGTVAWGRWTNGTLAGDGILSGILVSESFPLHYVVGMPATNIPLSGSGAYAQIGSSATCFGNGCTSASSLSSLAVDFANASVALSMQVTIDGFNAGTYSFSGSPGTLSGAQINPFSGVFVGASTSSLDARGFLAGDGATRAGLAWQGQINFTDIAGATAYTKK